MQKLLTSDKIYISQSKMPKAERGVFAGVEIKKGEIVESCPIIEVSKHDTANLKESILVTYFFYFGRNKERLAITLGFGSIYNHSYDPNATFKIKSKEKLIDFIALKDIKKDEEITFNYNHGNPKNKKTSNDKTPLWFDVSTP
jgi:SET domain-containing protein